MRISLHRRATALVALGLALLPGDARAEGPSFACKGVEAGSIPAMICKSAKLSKLDRKMAAVYVQAMAKAEPDHPEVLRAEQRGWIKGRDECWKSADKRHCVEESYNLRIAELQARYRLVPVQGRATYVCGGKPAREITATYFETTPPTAVAEFGGKTSLMYQQPAASGAKYAGRNESIWEHQGEAMITWGYGSPEMHCTIKR